MVDERIFVAQTNWPSKRLSFVREGHALELMVKSIMSFGR